MVNDVLVGGIFLLLLLSMIVVVFALTLPKVWKDPYPLTYGQLTLVIIAVFTYNGELNVGGWRCILQLMGVALSALVNLLILPQYSGDALTEVVADCLEDSSQLVDCVMAKFFESEAIEEDGGMVDVIQIWKEDEDDLDRGYYVWIDKISAVRKSVDTLLVFTKWEQRILPCRTSKFSSLQHIEHFSIINRALRRLLSLLVGMDNCLRTISSVKNTISLLPVIPHANSRRRSKTEGVVDEASYSGAAMQDETCSLKNALVLVLRALSEQMQEDSTNYFCEVSIDHVLEQKHRLASSILTNFRPANEQALPSSTMLNLNNQLFLQMCVQLAEVVELVHRAVGELREHAITKRY